jgi:phosphate transport system substrate-binding protein
MPLSGSADTLSLADLTQISATSRRTCRVRVQSGDLAGEIYVETGSVVHARFGDLVGDDALYALLAAQNVAFEVDDDVRTLDRSIFTDWQQLILEGARLQDEGRVPQPRYRSAASSRSSSFESLVPMPMPASPSNELPPLVPAAPRSPVWRWAAVVAGAAVLLGVMALIVRGRTDGHPAQPTAAATPSPAAAVEASQLVAPGDAAPKLLEGRSPRSPNPALALTPTVVCRLLVDAQGHVAQARIYRSRLELAAFEDAALAAVQGWRFQPARHDGAVTSAWINWPVSFAAAGAAEEVIRVKGSDTIGGALGPDLGRAYSATHPGVRIAIESLGSATAFVGLFDGSAELGASSRPVNAAELAEAQRLGVTLKETVIGYDGIAVIVHPSNPLRSLTMEQVGKLFTGELTRWSQVGGPDRAVRLFGRPSYSGTHAFFREKVLRRGNAKGPEDFAAVVEPVEKTQDLVHKVSEDPGAVAYVGLGYVTAEVRALALSPGGTQPPILPERPTILDGTYPIYRPLNFYTRGTPDGELASFLRFVTSPAGQALVAQHGFAPGESPPDDPAAMADAPTGDSKKAPQVARVFFGRGSSTLDHEAIRLLSSLADTLKTTDRRVLLIGNADADGDSGANRHAARIRADRVAQFLTHAGIAESRLQVDEASADTPLASNHSDAGRSQNRRVDIFVLQK